MLGWLILLALLATMFVVCASFFVGDFANLNPSSAWLKGCAVGRLVDNPTYRMPG